MKKIIIFISILFLTGCTSEGIKSNHSTEKIINTSESVFEVRSVDWLFGNWVELCNDSDGCKTVNLHETKLRSSIKEGLFVKVTETKVNKGSREWTDIDYEYVE